MANAQQSTGRLFSELAPRALERLAENDFDPSALRTNATLPKDAWKEIDDTIYKIARRRFQAIEALRGAGVVDQLDGLHVLFDQWQQLSDFGEVTQSMDFLNQGPNDQTNFETYMIPIPLTHGDFQVGGRRMMNMQRTGNVSVDSSMIAQLTTKITAKLEDTLLHGTDVTINGQAAPGLLTHPDSYDVTSDPGWTGSWDSNPGDIYEDIKHLAQALKNDNNMYGPYLVFVSNDVFDAMNIADPEGTGDRDLMPRILEKDNIQQIVEVDQLDADHVIMMDPVDNVIQIPTAADLQAVEWETQGGYVTNYKVFSALAPRVMSDEDGNSGIVYATDA